MKKPPDDAPDEIKALYAEAILKHHRLVPQHAELTLDPNSTTAGLIIVMRASELTRMPVEGTIFVPCPDCGLACSLSPESQERLRRSPLPVLCLQCSVARYERRS